MVQPVPVEKIYVVNKVMQTVDEYDQGHKPTAARQASVKFRARSKVIPKTGGRHLELNRRGWSDVQDSPI